MLTNEPHNENRLTTRFMSKGAILPHEITVGLRRGGTKEFEIKVSPAGRTLDELRYTSEKLKLTQNGHVLIPPGVGLTSAGYKPGDVLQLSCDANIIEIERMTLSIAEQYKRGEVGPHGRVVPPAWMIQDFVGAPNTRGFVMSGKDVAQFFTNIAMTHLDTAMSRHDKVIDFGCGCGRVLSWMAKESELEYYGADLHREAMEWMRLAIPEATFYDSSSDFRVHENVTDASLIYANSVLTHLDEEFSVTCLKDWNRALKDGGLLLATFRDEEYVKANKSRQDQELIISGMRENDGFHFRSTRIWTGVFPSFYGGAFHSQDYVERVWGEIFDIKDIISFKDSPLGQNVAVLQKGKPFT